MTEKLCNTCVFLDRKNNSCILKRIPVMPLIDRCSYHRKELNNCNLCGNPVLENPLWLMNGLNDPNPKYICGNCSNQISTCGTCVHNSGCLYENESFCPEEPIMKTIVRQQGNMIIQQTAPNVDRIFKVCPQCDCFMEINGDKHCARRCFNTCEKYKMKGDN